MFLDCFQRIIIENGKNAVNRQLKYGFMQGLHVFKYLKLGIPMAIS